MRGVPGPPTAGETTVATLRAGDAIDTIFACIRKDRLTTKSGAAYLSLELRDRTGSVPARVFKDADRLAGRFERGQLVRVKATVERFREELQLDVQNIATAPAGAADPTRFLPVAYRDLDELDGFLEHLAAEVHDPGYAGLLQRLLGDEELRAAWRLAPCSPRAGHHAYLGGLLEHTVAVGTLALETCQLHVKLNSDLLITAALVHDLGKTREYAYGAEIELTEEGRLLGHVELGLRLVERAAGGLEEGRRLQLAHCVLTHHGADAAPQRRFGSPEAVALHRINALDAAVKGAIELGLG
ncbi:MAG: metal dependent phosphohydrolase [Solirubrobacterales bacterium]|jgi:3'-5' exoribonuclease|nr:metal dependent phosphohydrolase [Solirubrobacterales bacterium]